MDQADAATAEGRLTTPLAHLLSMMSFGVEECHYRFSDTGPR